MKDQELEYEFEILKHLEIDLGCPDGAIAEDFVQHPSHSKQLREEARYHTIDVHAYVVHSEGTR